jgi:hypothetical protein
MSINVLKEVIKRDQGWCKGQQLSFAGGDDGGYFINDTYNYCAKCSEIGLLC